MSAIETIIGVYRDLTHTPATKALADKAAAELAQMQAALAAAQELHKAINDPRSDFQTIIYADNKFVTALNALDKGVKDG